MSTEEAAKVAAVEALEKRVGLTPWVCAGSNPPPSEGWWKTRSKTSPNLRQPQRRYWRGPTWGFSLPVMPTMSDEDADWLSGEQAMLFADSIEWCGLAAPHPDHKS